MRVMEMIVFFLDHGNPKNFIYNSINLNEYQMHFWSQVLLVYIGTI